MGSRTDVASIAPATETAQRGLALVLLNYIYIYIYIYIYNIYWDPAVLLRPT